MRNNRDHADFVDRLTGFAMHQASRRGFIKWLGKAGLALAAGATGGIELLRQTVFSAGPDGVPCSYYLPGCTGPCKCSASCCVDPDNGAVFCCTGSCCGCNPIYYLVNVYWFWNGSKCVQTYGCIQCVP